ncbi:glycoside hydrolase family 19 protein [Burkholderia gladioli]|jgi:predicted chitinase|uniref:glycoside hydrolase family 19 protein n=1 Tax=Burkholderia gladioli TaxID=28095 RepID=UPI00163F8473|nr:hypothetical protein [Burkholderia gladioli]
MAADTGDTLTAISQWAYPFPQKDASAAIDPDAYLAALQGSDGPFPLGLNGLWHGGIHFDQEGGSSASGDLDHSGGVRCIADGEVVAYCLDSDYQRLTYPDQSTVLYSRSFTLVRHKLTLPPVPAGTSNSASNTPASSNKPSIDPADSLVFFSLYMHLAPCKVYKHSEQDKNKKTWPGYYNAESIYTVKSTYTVNAKDALDQQENVKSGEPIKGIHVHRDKRGHPEKNLGILPSGSKVKIQRPARAPKGWGRIEAIVSGEIAPITPGGTVEADASKGWVYLAAFDDEINPAALDKAYVLPKPIRIGAGEVIGYLGEYQNVQHASTLPPSPQRALLHVEVFAGDDLPTFMTRSVARAAQLTQEPKTQLVLEKGAVLYGYKAEGDLTLPEKTVVTPTKDSPERGAWAKVQIKGSADTTSYWIQRSELDGKGTRKAWREFPLSTANAPAGTNDYLRVVNIGGLVEFVDDKKHSWYQVDAGDAEQKTINGFVCASGQAHVSLQNKWAWAGFKLLSSNLSTADLYKRFLHLKNDNGTTEEKAAFEASFNSAKSDALVTQLDEALMSAEHRQGKVLGEDVLSALRDKWRANRVDHLVVKYESEWGGQMSKWDALDPLMHEGLPYWKVEKDRIKQLQVWDACEEALKPLSGPSVYHLHPVGFVGNFLVSGKCDCAGSKLDLASMRRIATICGDAKINEYLDSINQAFIDYKINKCMQRAYFISQILTESAEFRYTREQSKNNAPLEYDPWRGRGLIQLTHKENYDAYQKYSGEDVTSGMAAIEKVEKTPHSVLSAAWFFVDHVDLLKPSEDDDLIWVTRIINGGFNGYDNRLKYLNRSIKVWGLETCAKLNRNGVYRFEESRAYNEKRASFGWGHWHDPDSTVSGTPKDKDEAIKGFRRYLELDDAAGKPVDKHGKPKDQNWYHTAIVRPHVEARLAALTKS